MALQTLAQNLGGALPAPQKVDFNTAVPGPDGNYYAVNPKTGQLEMLVASFVPGSGYESGLPEYTTYFASEVPADNQQHAPLAVAQDGGFDLGDALGGIGSLIGGTAAFGVGGLTGASPFTGMDPQDALMLDAAGLATGIGLGSSGVLDAGLTGAADTAVLAGGDAAVTGAADTLAAGEFTGGLTGAATGAPGLAAPGATTPGISAGIGASALAPGAFAAESLYPVAGGLTAASAAAPAIAGNAGVASALGISPATLQMLGVLGATGLGVYGANQQADAYGDLANQLRADRQPYLNQSLAWMNDPNAYFEGPGKAALDANLRALSIHGNPAGSPWAIATANEAALRDWRNAVSGFGNLGLGGQGLQAQATGNSINADTNVYNAIGAGLGQLTNPQPTLEQLIRQLSGSGVSL